MHPTWQVEYLAGCPMTATPERDRLAEIKQRTMRCPPSFRSDTEEDLDYLIGEVERLRAALSGIAEDLDLADTDPAQFRIEVQQLVAELTEERAETASLEARLSDPSSALPTTPDRGHTTPDQLDALLDALRLHCLNNHDLIGKVEATHRSRFARAPACDRPECQDVAHTWVQSVVGRRGTFTPYEQDRTAEAGGQ